MRGDMIQTYRFLHGYENVQWHKILTLNTNNCRGDNYKLFLPFSKNPTRKHFYSNRVIQQWNKLSTNTKSSGTINQFKANLDKELKHLWYDYDE